MARGGTHIFVESRRSSAGTRMTRLAPDRLHPLAIFGLHCYLYLCRPSRQSLHLIFVEFAKPGSMVSSSIGCFDEH